MIWWLLLALTGFTDSEICVRSETQLIYRGENIVRRKVIGSQLDDLWLKDGSYQRIFHNEKWIVEFTEADLRMLGEEFGPPPNPLLGKEGELGKLIGFCSVSEFESTIRDYNRTDYSDLGENHSHPVLRNRRR